MLAVFMDYNYLNSKALCVYTKTLHDIIYYLKFVFGHKFPRIFLFLFDFNYEPPYRQLIYLWIKTFFKFSRKPPKRHKKYYSSKKSSFHSKPSNIFLMTTFHSKLKVCCCRILIKLKLICKKTLSIFFTIWTSQAFNKHLLNFIFLKDSKYRLPEMENDSFIFCGKRLMIE